MTVFIIVGISIVVLILVLLNRFPLVKVVGDSMYPTFKNGDILIGTTHFKVEEIEVNDVLVFKSPVENKMLIKRVLDVYKEQFSDSYVFFMIGDNRDVSRDSRYFGWIEEKDLIAKVIIPKRERRY